MEEETKTEKNIENKELEERSKLADERLIQLKYLQADFDNYRKKFEKEKEEIIKLANENLIKEMLNVIEDFEIALKQIKDEKTKEGLKMVFNKFIKTLEKQGLKQIDSLGKKFDYNLHEAVIKEPSEKGECIVLEEYQKGYMLKSKVIRPSKVKISEKERSKESSQKNHNHGGNKNV